MKSVFGRMSSATVAILAVASFAMAPYADAAGGNRGGGGGGGGGGRGGGGGAHAAAGGGGGGARAGGGANGGARQNAQVNNTRADARTNNVRSTSVNNVNNVNVNVDRNVNVNVSGDNRCCNNGWDNDYHPVATAAAVGAAVAVTSAVVGSMVRSVPPGCAPVNYGGVVYQQCGGTWYAPQGSQFVVVSPPY